MTLKPATQSLSAASPNQSSGPPTNRGPNSTLAAPFIDWLTLAFPASENVPATVAELHAFLDQVFGFGGKIAVGPVQDKVWNWCPRHAKLVAADGSSAGMVGFREDGGVLLSLSGVGCAQVESWAFAYDNLVGMNPRVTRVDVAVDDTAGTTFSVESFRKAYAEGAFTTTGRPPDASYRDDLGSGKGCTLYVGKKGHKELCVYDKGKQLGDLDSPHTRCEVRLYGNKIELGLDVLCNPGEYFAAAYPLLREFVRGEMDRLALKERLVNISAHAMVEVVKQQAGSALHLVYQALGEEAFAYIVSDICREGTPARFRGFVGDLPAFVRASLSTPSANQ